MKTRVSKTSAAALLAIVLSLNVSLPAQAAQRGGDEFGNVRERIVRFIHDMGRFFLGSTSSESLTGSKP